MMKKIAALILGIIMIISIAPTSAFAANHYIYNDIKEIDITTGTVTFTDNTTNIWSLSTGDHIDIYATNPVTVRGTNKVCISCYANSNVTLDNVTIDMSNFYNGSPLSFYAAGSVLTLVGDSTIIGTNKAAYDSTAAVSVRSGNSVTIDSASGGSLAAVGGYGCAGIGSSNRHTAGTIIINGGNITATGGERGAGIGGGYDNESGSITINGGIVTASHNNTGAGIGCGAMGDGVNINITGGEVYAKGDGEGDDIGTLYSSSVGAFTISGDAAVFAARGRIVPPATTHTKVSHETITGNSAYGYTNIPSSWSGTGIAYIPLTTYAINDTTIAAYGNTTDLNSISTAIDTIQIDTTQAATIKDSAPTDRAIEIECIRSNTDIVVEDVRIDVSGVTDGKALSFTGTDNGLTLVGSSVFTSHDTQPAIAVEGGALSINSSSEGKLHAAGSLGNAGAQINILGGEIYAQTFDGNVNIGGTSAVFGIDASAFNHPTTTIHTYVDSDDIVNNHAYGYSRFPDSWSSTAYGYIINPFTITFIDEDEYSILDTLKVSDGKKINKDNTPMKPGYTGNWYRHSTYHVGSQWDFDSDIPTGDMTLYVDYILDTYNISYHLDGGTNGPANKSTYTYNDDDITLLDASKEGYTFDGWYDDASFSGSVSTLLDTSDEEDKDYYAKWIANGAIITFDGNGSTSGAVPSDISSVTGANISLPANTGSLAKIGFIFEGWSETIDGSEITGQYAVPIGGSTLYAVWSVDALVPRYDVTFDAQDGSSVSNQTIPEGAYASKPDDRTKSGYTFGGWYTDAACQDDNRWNFVACPVIGDMRLYAKWNSILAIDTPNLLSVTIGEDYSCTINASGGDRTYSWYASGLPSGLGIARDTGTISGTPNETGAFSASVRVYDGENKRAEKTYSLTVNEQSQTGKIYHNTGYGQRIYLQQRGRFYYADNKQRCERIQVY